MVEESSKSKPVLILTYLSSIHFLWDGSNAIQPRSFTNISTHAWVVFSPEFVSSNKKPFIYRINLIFDMYINSVPFGKKTPSAPLRWFSSGSRELARGWPPS